MCSCSTERPVKTGSLGVCRSGTAQPGPGGAELSSASSADLRLKCQPSPVPRMSQWILAPHCNYSSSSPGPSDPRGVFLIHHFLQPEEESVYIRYERAFIASQRWSDTVSAWGCGREAELSRCMEAVQSTWHQSWAGLTQGRM